ncbi:MAG: IclR family transcriptional regulator, partial [Burkholderiales bacterium]|nr:IclR family transcriptional regulator [Burkholderiales bacterium]
MVRVLQRALAILECFSREKPALTLQEIYRKVELPKSTTFRLVTTLQNSGYLLQRADQRYSLSYKLLLLGSVVLETQDVREITRPVMEELARVTGETVTLSTRSGHERICLDVVESSSLLRSIVLPGDRLPLLYGATGKMLLAQLDDATIEEIRKTQQLPRKRISRKDLAETVARIRERGYALTRDDRVDGVMAISVPLRDNTGQVRYCMTVTGPSIRFKGREQALVEQMLRVGRRLSTLLGHAPARVPVPA